VQLTLLPEEEASVASFNSRERQVALFATGEPALNDLQRVAEESGLKVMSATDLSTQTAADPLDFRGDMVFVDVSGASVDHDNALLAKLDRIDAIAGERRTPVIANTTPDHLDLLVARLSGPTVTILCDANPVDWVVALSLAQMERTSVREIKVDEAARLQRLSDEVDRIAQLLAGLVESQPPSYAAVQDVPRGFRAQPSAPQSHVSNVSADDVRKIVRLRRLREQFFQTDLFADPAWDMLLDLTIARIDGVAIAVSSLCIAAAVPATTALRWIKTMTDNGIFVRVGDPTDGRRVFIELSEDAATKMMAYLSAAKAQSGLAI
jgi:Winged helix DNA-binding domain